MDWFYSPVRIAGASFPVTASLVQLQAEVDAKAFRQHWQKLEDPISSLHEDVPALSAMIYGRLQAGS